MIASWIKSFLSLFVTVTYELPERKDWSRYKVGEYRDEINDLPECGCHGCKAQLEIYRLRYQRRLVRGRNDH